MTPQEKKDPRKDRIEIAIRDLLTIASVDEPSHRQVVSILADRELGAYTAGYITGAKHQAEATA